MRIFRNLRISQKMLVLSLLFALGMIGFAVGAFATLETLRINGAQYKRIVQGKDLIADILPPPVYLIEAYLVSFQAANESDPARADALLAKLETLKTDYLSRHDYWTKELEEGPLKEQLVVKAHQPAKAFLDAISRDLVPMIRSRNLAAARVLINGPLQQSYENHRLAIDDAVKMATTRNSEDERLAAELIKTRSLWLLALAISTLAVMFGVSLLLGQEMSRSMGVMVESLNELGRGHLKNARDLLRGV
jgi:methyl-accepting chemotaxis protein